MSDQETSSETKVASAETISAPPQPVFSTAQEPVAVPAFGSSRGSGLARGKRAPLAAPASATQPNDATQEYKPTAIQVVTTEREYKNPFAAETPSVPVETTTPVASVTAELPAKPVSFTPATPAPNPAPKMIESAIASPLTSDAKAELNILPPEQRQQPSQSWESSSFPETKSPASSDRREDRPTFRVEKRDNRENVPARETIPAAPTRSADFRHDQREPRENRDQRENRNPRENREPRDPREQRQARDPREARQPRDPREARTPRDPREDRDQRPLTQRPLPAPPAPKKTGLWAWIKNLFAGSPAVEKPADPVVRRPDDRQNDDGFRRQHQHRGGRGRGGVRGENRDNNRGPREAREGQSPASENGNNSESGENQFDGGQRRRRHRGGRGRGGFDNRNGGGDRRPDQGGPNNS